MRKRVNLLKKEQMFEEIKEANSRSKRSVEVSPSVVSKKSVEKSVEKLPEKTAEKVIEKPESNKKKRKVSGRKARPFSAENKGLGKMTKKNLDIKRKSVEAPAKLMSREK